MNEPSVLQRRLRQCALLLLLTLPGYAGFAQRPDSRSGPPTDPGGLSVKNVCAAATELASRGDQFQWTPDSRFIAYFKPLATGFGLRLELDLVSAAGSERKVLLNQAQIDKLFPATDGAEGKVPPPREATGFAWSPDSRGLLLHSDRTIAWLDLKTAQTRVLVQGKETLGDVQLSPDGYWVAFVRNHNLWIAPVAGGPERAITRGGTESLLKAELDWLYPAELGTKHGFAWSPDSSRIAYFVFDLKSVARYTPPFVSDDDSSQTIDYPIPGSKNPVVGILVASVKRQAPTISVDTGSDKSVYLPRLQWLPDSKRLAIQRLNRPQNQLELLMADAHTGSLRTLLTEKDAYWINLSDTLYFLKSAPQFIWSSERSGFRHLYLYGLDGKLARQLTDGQWEVASLDSVDERSGKIYYTSTERSPLERQLYSASLDGAMKKGVSSGSGTHEATFAPDATAYVDRFSTATRPWTRSIYRLDATPGAGSSAAKMAALDETATPAARSPVLHEVMFLTVKTHDGVELNGMMIRPTPFNPEKKYPVVMYVNGAPGSQTVRDRWDGDVSLWNQLLVSQGFLVFAVDNRGTAGRGHPFEEYVHLRFEGQELADQQDAVLFLKSLPYVDPARLGIWGRGFGGALTVRSMLHPPILYKAAFAVAPIINWTRYDSAFAERYLGDPVSNQDGYLSSSPLDEWQRYKGPMLVGQGTADLSVHPDQLMELQEDLVEKRKYLEMAFYPGQSHNIDKPDACEVLYQRATDFFGKNL